MSAVIDEAATTDVVVPSVDVAPESQPVGWRHRHLLDVDGLTAVDLDLVMRTADAMREVLARPIAKVPALRGRNVTILFYEASTRTRVSFEVAAKNLSADVVNIAAATSSVTKGESLVDTVRTVEALGAQMLVIRHSVSGAPYLAAEVFSGSVLNGGDGWHAHPTQALLDLYTMRSRLDGGSVAGRKVVILGDVLHSRVARSNIWSLTAAGADLWLCGPPTLLRGFEAWAGRGAAAGRRFHVTSSVEDALRDADVVMALRIQRERMSSGLLPSLREYAARYGLTAARLALAKPGALVMHPGPMNEGVEIAADVAAGPQSVITDQVTNGVAIRMALLYLLAGCGGRGLGRLARRERLARRMTDLDIGRAWLVDPAAGREGPGEIVVRDGILEAVTWLEREEADGIDAGGVVVAPGFIDLHAHLREPGNEDAETVASGLAAAAHGGFTTVCAMPNTTPTLDEPGVLSRIQAAAAASGSAVELLAYGAVSTGRARRDAGGPRRAGGCRCRGLLRRRCARSIGIDPAQCARVRGGVRPPHRGPPRGSDPHRWRRGERRVHRDRPGAARVAGCRGGGGRGP